MFANRYISQNISYPEFIESRPNAKLGIIVVIPCYREPNILQTLQSLKECTAPSCTVDVIVVINRSAVDNEEVIQINDDTYFRIREWKEENDLSHIHFHPIVPEPFPKKYAGAGLARKTGMDEAIRRFHVIGKNRGIIVSLDADTTVDPNYLVEIEKFFCSNLKHIGATIRFQHRIDPETMSSKQIEGIHLYERYLHYYKNALTYTGYPFAIFTIGSAFCCTAEAYTKQGGMNKRQAGEDFYFLHKLSMLGPIGEINSTCVYPLARLSDRVPFGTGPVLQRWINGEEDLNLTYNLQAFNDLKILFDQTDQLFKITEVKYNSFLNNLPAPMKDFLTEGNFFEELKIVNQHSATIASFNKRFFQVFNAFKILKYINFSHLKFYQKIDITVAENGLYLYKTD